MRENSARAVVPHRGDEGGLFLTITILVGLTIAAAACLFAPQIVETRVVFRTEPDYPAAFGSDMAWMAIRTRDTKLVAEALGLVEPQACNWNSGIGTVYDRMLGEDHIFVSPPVGPWTFVIGLALPHPMPRGFADKCTPVLVALGGRFPEIQYYVSFPLIDMFAWARMSDGRLVRAFAVNDEGVIWSKGRTTRDETLLGLKLFELRGVKGRSGDAGGEILLHPTEEHVMRLAGRWSLDPMTLDGARATPALGIIARAPAAWRAERLRKSAA